KARVRWKQAPVESAVLPAPWAEAEAHAGKSMMTFQAAVLGYATFREKGADVAAAESPFGSEEGEAARPLWAFLAAQTAETSCDLALWLLQHHARPEGRLLAA